jgi:hypothetical protein
LLYKSNIEESHGAKLNARWQGPYHITDMAQSLATCQLPELDGAEFAGCINVR